MGLSVTADTRPQFEDAIWSHYQALKARGWSAPEEGNPDDPDALFWRHPNGQYGVRSVEQAWRGWCMREAYAIHQAGVQHLLQKLSYETPKS